jgi:hypothetical protein
MTIFKLAGSPFSNPRLADERQRNSTSTASKSTVPTPKQS